MGYDCSICGKSGIKLWRPETSTKPLVCADCAKKLQVSRKGLKIKWSRASQKKKLQFPEGTEYDPNGNPVIMIESLNANLSSHDFNGTIILIPAIPDENGIYLNRDSIYKTGQINFWKLLPTYKDT